MDINNKNQSKSDGTLGAAFDPDRFERRIKELTYLHQHGELQLAYVTYDRLVTCREIAHCVLGQVNAGDVMTIFEGMQASAAQYLECGSSAA